MKALHFLPITLLSIISCMSIIACSNDDSNKKNDEVITITPLGNSQRYFDNGQLTNTKYQYIINE